MKKHIRISEKHLLLVLVVIIITITITGCKDEDIPDELIDVILINIDVPSVEEIKEFINTKTDLTASDDLVINAPDEIYNIAELSSIWENTQSDSEQHRAFNEIFSFIFPDREMDNNFFFDLDGILKYDESEYGLQEYNNEIAMAFGSPVGNNYTRINRGRGVSLVGIMPDYGRYPSVYAFEPARHFERVTTHQPSSTISYQLLDGERPINEAVAVFEEFINSLPLLQNPTMDMRVMEVDVLKVGEDLYGYNFITSKVYGNIPFDYMRSGTNWQPTEVTKNYFFFLGYGFMLVSYEVDSIYGLQRLNEVSPTKTVDSIISINQALEQVSDALTDAVELIVERIDLVYIGKDYTYPDVERTKAISQTTTAWKVRLYNVNDNFRYIAYVDAADGSNFRYYTQTN
ncbi:MAG: hypothetical protein LBC71_00575 [Oscillospiraceae bacterium]|jgi:hypothetical protein|nr:hypothetical protein [Oscillospiraceae bacterium]